MFRKTGKDVNRPFALGATAGSAGARSRRPTNLQILPVDRVRLAVGLDGSRDEPDLVRLELHETHAEALRKAVDRMRLLLLHPGDESRDRKLAHVAGHLELHEHLVPRGSE